jgi:predicted GNAT family acetyltransferase
MPEVVARALAATMADRCPSLPGVNGPQLAAAAFADRWQELTGHGIGQVRALMLARCTEVKLSEWPDGRMRPATAAEAPVLAGWIASVFAQVGLPSPEVTARQQIDEQLSGGRLFVWDNGAEMVAVTGHATPVAGVAMVHGGFASPKHRTSWYGTAIVAGVSDHVLKHGCTACIAITDRANRHTAAVLRAIGYEPVSELSDYQFPATPARAAPAGAAPART